MMKALILLTMAMVGLCSCGQRQTSSSKEAIKSETKDTIPSYRSNDHVIHTKYEYRDSFGKRLIIQNGFPKGGMEYTDPNGEVYRYVIFWTQITNEADKPLELSVNFPIDSYRHPSLPGKYFEILVPADTMTLDKVPLFNYGLTDLTSFLDQSIHKPSSLKRTIKPRASSGFYVIMLGLKAEGPQGMLRTGLNLRGQDLFYRIARYSTSKSPISLIDEKEIHCGNIDLNGFVLQK